MFVVDDDIKKCYGRNNQCIFSSYNVNPLPVVLLQNCITYSIIVAPLETNNAKGKYPNNAVAIQKDADHEDDRNNVVGLATYTNVVVDIAARTTEDT